MLRGRRLSQLKVEELKQELESRGLKKSGNKGVLIERLQEVIFNLKGLIEKERRWICSFGFWSFMPSFS